MPFAARHRNDPTPPFHPLPGLAIDLERDPGVMAALQGRTVEAIMARFAAGHRAYVACRDGDSAARGRMSCAPERCACDYQQPQSGFAA